MGTCAEETAKEMSISREEQDAYAIDSYKRAAEAWASGAFKAEVVPVKVSGKGGKGDKVIDKDEEFTNVDFAKIPKLKGAFVRDGLCSILCALNHGCITGKTLMD